MKKTISLLLVLIMLLALCVPAYAESEGLDYDIVAIGDSTSNGFFLDDYGQKEDSVWAPGDKCYGSFDCASRYCEGNVLGDFVQQTLGRGYNVNVTNLTFEGMRSNELRGLLDPAFAEESQQRGTNGDGFFQHYYYGYLNWFAKYKDTVFAEYDSMTDLFHDKIKNAETIILDAQMNNFGVYLVERLMASFGVEGYDIEDYDQSLDDMKYDLDIDADGVIDMMKGLAENAGIELPELLDAVVDTLSYCYCDFRVNFTKNIETIRKLNPNAKLIVVGTYNPMANLNAAYEELSIDFGALSNAFMRIIDTYITTTCKYRYTYSFADCSGGVHSYIDGLAEGDPAPTYRNILIKDARNTIIAGFKAAIVDKIAEKMSLSEEDKALITDDTCQFMLNLLSGSDPEIAAYAECFNKALNITDDEIIARFSEAAAIPVLNVNDILEGMTGDYETMAVFGLLKDEPSNAELALLHIFARFMSSNGLGAHPDATGCAQKAEAVKAAWLKSYPAAGDYANTVTNLASNFFTAILSLFGDSFASAVSSFFEMIWNNIVSVFQNLFAGFIS